MSGIDGKAALAEMMKTIDEPGDYFAAYCGRENMKAIAAYVADLEAENQRLIALTGKTG
jgi:hypothetical protein